jgi:nicotinate-nucleotide pyrophosphorylase (carboxylating)
MAVDPLAASPGRPKPPEAAAYRSLIDLAWKEDLGTGDVTTSALVPRALRGKFRIIAKSEGVLCGAPVAASVFARFAPTVTLRWEVRDGDRIAPQDVIVAGEGLMSEILSAERLSLNFLQRMSGIATKTNQVVRLLAQANPDCRTRILDTRKTTPGHRLLDKYAVAVGGGGNHRKGLYDELLIKENHIAFAAVGIAGAIAKGRQAYPNLRLVVEVRDLDELAQALDARPDVILLDNMNIETMTTARERRDAAAAAAGSAPIALEISGGVTEATIPALAQLNLERISVGALTHTIVPLDMSLLADAAV